MATNVMVELNDAMLMCTNVAAAYADPNDSTKKTAAKNAVQKLLVDFGTPASVATVIAQVTADGLETVAGGSSAAVNVLNDLTTAAASKGVVLNQLELMFISMFLNTAIATVQSVTKKKS